MYRSRLPAFNADAALEKRGGEYEARRWSAEGATGRVVPSMRSPMCRYLGARCAGGDGQACVWYFDNC